MKRTLLWIRRHLIDGVTIVVLGVAAFVAWQPGSFLRSKFDRFMLDRKTLAVAQNEWVELERIASDLTGQRRFDVIEVLDYECPFCRAATASIDSAVKSGLRVGLLSYPLASHKSARAAALASLCAEDLGRFSQMHVRLLTSEEWQADSAWVREASLVGIVDSAAFQQCMSSGLTEKRLEAQMKWADSLSTLGTPMFVSRTGVHRGLPSAEILLNLGTVR